MTDEEISAKLAKVFAARYERASQIQKFSRQAAKPATEKGSNEIKMCPNEFIDYNCLYKDAAEWQEQ